MATTSNDKISQILSNPEKVRDIIQAGINEALKRHKLAGNLVCELKDGKVYGIQPENISINLQ